MAVGLPSLTGLTGLASAFAGELAKEAGLPPTAFTNAGVMLAFENYHLHEGYKKIVEKEVSGSKLATRALASAFASFTAHLAIEVESKTEEAADALNNRDLGRLAQSVLCSLRLCGASLIEAPLPTLINSEKKDKYGSERLAALAMIPSSARVIVDSSLTLELMREQNLSLMEGLVAATINPKFRPAPYKEFFEKVVMNFDNKHLHSYGVVHDGYQSIGKTGRPSIKTDYFGNRPEVQVVSPTHTLVRLQQVSSLRSAPAVEGSPPSDFAFWKMYSVEGGVLCRT